MRKEEAIEVAWNILGSSLQSSNGRTVMGRRAFESSCGTDPMVIFFFAASLAFKVDPDSLASKQLTEFARIAASQQQPLFAKITLEGQLTLDGNSTIKLNHQGASSGGDIKVGLFQANSSSRRRYPVLDCFPCFR